ncbi:MAG: tRNA (N6-threonylcarbamoyladenosine(37)-N6)-methyltransferase TrmO [Desulfomonile tiedjei]|nr:tRNA (N6-threonylcarbamoyladenosine(37)-N6)-methyltransferase TrmO [Desulfomonile tiedjei]
MEGIAFKPIGVIHSPFREREGTPIQPAGARGIEGTVELLPEYAAGCKDLDGFSHIVLLYHFHRSKGFSLELTPFLDDTPRGVFATRAPARPNPIGISVVRLVGVEGSTLHIQDLDILDGTPLLDIKPYVPEIGPDDEVRFGWLEGKTQRMGTAKADERFR